MYIENYTLKKKIQSLPRPVPAGEAAGMDIQAPCPEQGRGRQEAGGATLGAPRKDALPHAGRAGEDRKNGQADKGTGRMPWH